MKKQSYARTTVMPRACRVVWDDAVRVFGKNGFRLFASDRAGGVATFKLEHEDFPGFRQSGEDAGRFINANIEDWDSLKLESTVLTLTPQSSGCQVGILLTYLAYEGGFWNKSWTRTETTGYLENRLLSEVRGMRSAKRGVSEARQLSGSGDTRDHAQYFPAHLSMTPGAE